ISSARAEQSLNGLSSAPSRVAQQGDIEETYDARALELGRMAQKNPRQAIAAAATLPMTAEPPRSWESTLVPRAHALLAIARVSQKQDVSATRDALEELLEALKDADAQRQVDCYVEAVELATAIRDSELARKLMHAGMREVEHLRAKDMDPSDPNLALKAWWPSTAAAWRLLAA